MSNIKCVLPWGVEIIQCSIIKHSTNNCPHFGILGLGAKKMSEGEQTLVINTTPWFGHMDWLVIYVLQSYNTSSIFMNHDNVSFQVEVINGDLICPESSRKFPVTDGIPNMLLNEDEI